MPRKIIQNDENKELAKAIILKILDNKTYIDIANELGYNKNYIYELVKTYKHIFGINGVLTKYHGLKLTGELNKIIEDYKQGKSTEELAREYNVTDHTIASWLRKEGIIIRDFGKVSRINQNVFDEITTEIQAYTLGLIIADGSISRKGNTITICLTKDDDYILHLINENLLDGLGTIFINHKEDTRPRSILSFNGKHIKETLSKYGIIPDKSHIITQLSKAIPENLYHHYIRGLFDGDGVCSYYTSHKKQKLRIGYCAYKKEFVKDFVDFLHKKLNLPVNKLFNTGGCWQCSWGANHDIKTFYDYIYHDSTIYLGRKYKKITQYLKNNNLS